MKIAKALKHKNKIVAELKMLRERIEEYNSILTGNPRPYDITETQAQLMAKVQERVLLKTQLVYIPVNEPHLFQSNSTTCG